MWCYFFAVGKNYVHFVTVLHITVICSSDVLFAKAGQDLHAMYL